MKKVDVQGQRFGRLMVIGEAPRSEKDRTRRMVYCKCDCGNTIAVRVGNLRSGNTISCGCFEREQISKRSMADIVGKRFGRLLVLRNTDERIGEKVVFECLCECGNTKKVISTDLIHGKIRSCGCYKRDMAKQNYTEDLTGRMFGELIAIKQVDDHVLANGDHRVQWLFRCSCGREIIEMPMNVKRGRVKSCGHIGASYGEYIIEKTLTTLGIEHTWHDRQDDLRNPKTGRKLEFDFSLKDSDGNLFFIEHQGEQHFYECKQYKKFGKQQREETDIQKKEYCKERGIRLFETRFDEDIQKAVLRILDETGIKYDISKLKG